MKNVLGWSHAVNRRVNRRSAVSALLGLSLLDGEKLLGQEAAGSPAGGTFPWQSLLSQLAVTTGPWRGAFRSAPNGPISWYFTNLGLAFFTDVLPDTIRHYLDLYIKSLNAENVITDVAADLSTPVAPDSHDAYAGSFLSLAVRYVRATSDSTWWNANLGRLKAVAYSNLLTQLKPNGLVRAFQSPHPNGIGYLMDQCEAYAGLRDFGQYLIETNDADATYYSGFAMNLGIAIHTQFDANANLWFWCDVPSPPGDAWYPNLTAQIYPHLYDVHSTDAPGDYYRLHRGFEVLSLGAPDWSTRPQDLYPWLVVGYYAAVRREQPSEAQAMLSMVLQYFLPGLVNTGRLLISEIGYVRGILASAALVTSAQPHCTAA
jgi:hypothetical protein